MLFRIKPNTIIPYQQTDMFVLPGKLYQGTPALRIFGNIVYSFFENKKEIPALLHSKTFPHDRIIRFKINVDIFWFKRMTQIFPHSYC